VLSLVSTFLLSNAFAKEYFYTRSERDSSDSLRNELNAAYIDGTVEPAALASAVDDAPSEYIDIGFSFPFSGSSYSKMGVDSNGFINFQSFSPCNEKYCLQDSKNSISPFSVDLFPGLVYDLLNSDAILEDAYYGLQPEAFNIFVFKKPNQTTVMWEKREVGWKQLIFTESHFISLGFSNKWKSRRHFIIICSNSFQGWSDSIRV